MSRAYRISVKESLSRHVQVEDGISSSLELLPILEKERMRELLAQELERRGFTREGQHAKRAQGGGITVSVDVDQGEVSVTAEGHHELDLEAERTAVVDVEVLPDKQRALRAVAQQALESQAAAETEALRKQVTETLERTLRDVKGELDDVVNRVTGAALKVRAGELGQVEAVHEDANGSVTIRVRV